MTHYLRSITGRYVSSGERSGYSPDRAGGYQWRDPRRVSPSRLAELQAHDRAHPATISNPRRDAKLEYALRTAMCDPFIAWIMRGEDVS